MSYRVLLFGAEALAAGAHQLDLHSEEPALTVEDLKALLAEAAPPISGILPSCRVAVNQAFVGDDAKMTPNDEIALIGMVSGG